MKNRILLTLFIGLFSIPIFSQELAEFGDLSSNTALLFNSVSTDDGIVYFINNAASNKLVKIDYEGKIVLEKELPFDDDLYYTGHLLQGEEKLYLVGHQRLFPNGSNNQAIWESQRRSVLEIDANLEVEKIHLFESILLGAGEVVSSSGTYVGVYNPTAVAEINGQIAALWPYLIFDTDDGVSIIGGTFQLELMDLAKGEIIVNQLQNVTQELGAVFLEEEVLIYGETADSILPNGVSLNPQPISSYSYAGELQELFSFDENLSGGVGDGSVGQLFDENIFSSYYGRDVNTQGCEQNTAVIDVRNKDFQLVNITKVPDCEIYPVGKNPFAFTADNNFYYSTINAIGNIVLYKYDMELNFQWKQLLDLPGERPISMKTTPNGGVILECFKLDNPNSLIKLYAFNPAGDVVSSLDIPIAENLNLHYGPNPTNQYIYPQTLNNPATELRIYSMLGQLVQTHQVQNEEVDLAQLPPGNYVLQSFDVVTKRLVGLQSIIKL